MKKAQDYGGIDRFRLVAALLIVGIHTSPLSSINKELDFLMTHVIARIAVPFFLMVTGYFLMPLYLSKETRDVKPLIGFIKKTGLIYAGATLLYLPISIYAGYYSEGNIAVNLIKNIIFDGTFYHLWYLPASIIGVSLLYLLDRKFPFRAILGMTGFLYLIGLLGDSYYGITSGVPFLSTVYDAGFHVFSYTRNGLFYAPIFLVMGAVIAKSGRYLRVKASTIGFAVSMLLMLTEGFVLHHFDFQRHDSMYIALIPSMFFLFHFLLTRRGKASPLLRDVSMWIYILHPFFIIAVRGAAKVTRLTGLLVDNSLIHYFAVCLLSLTFSVFIAILRLKGKSSAFHMGRAWIELDMQSLRHNVNVLRSLLPNHCQLMPVVKADAYGHGAIEITRELNAIGIRAFCVASVLEGVELRRYGVKGEILILGYTHPKQFCLLSKYHLIQTVIDYGYAKTLDSYGKKLTVHIKVDTGMHRLGERSENIDAILRIFQCKNLVISGVYSHLCADDNDSQTNKTFTQMQIDNFYCVLSKIGEQGYTIPKVHIQSSYGIYNRPDLSFDCARIGIALYGMLSSLVDTEKYSAGLRPVLSLKVRISMTRMLFSGEPAGYGPQFTAPHDMRIAVLAIGYADGIPRSLSCGAGHVLINGQKAAIVGRICMDQMMVDITGIKGVSQGDVAVIVGKSGNAEITACDIADQTGTIANEILSRLGKRLEKYCVHSCTQRKTTASIHCLRIRR